MRAIKRNRRSRPDVESRIRDSIGTMKMLLHSETYEIELLEYDGTTGETVLRISGECPECDMNATGFLQGIEAHLRLRVPEISSVRAVCPDNRSNVR